MRPSHLSCASTSRRISSSAGLTVSVAVAMLVPLSLAVLLRLPAQLLQLGQHARRVLRKQLSDVLPIVGIVKPSLRTHDVVDCTLELFELRLRQRFWSLSHGSLRRVLSRATGNLGMLILAVMPVDRAAALRAERLEPPFERLKALHTPKRPPRPGDWLAEHHEAGQSFAEFARSLPLAPTAARYLCRTCGPGLPRSSAGGLTSSANRRDLRPAPLDPDQLRRTPGSSAPARTTARSRLADTRGRAASSRRRHPGRWPGVAPSLPA